MREAIKMVKKRRPSGQTQIYAVPVVIAEITVEPSEGIRKAKTRSRVPSIAKHGRDRAIEIATEWRREQERLLAGESANDRRPTAKQKRAEALGSDETHFGHGGNLLARDDEVIQHPGVHQRQC